MDSLDKSELFKNIDKKDSIVDETLNKSESSDGKDDKFNEEGR
tara:strand:+ start:524 stop:652 length:129 start_codon:yes stop_codon:yes gene_type:complete